MVPSTPAMAAQVVLPGADHSSLQLFVGVDEVEACFSEQGDGVGLGVR